MRKLYIAPFVGVLLLTGCSVSPLNVLSVDQRVELRDGSSEYQQGVLDDLVVDESEYRLAVDDWWNCVQETGAEPSEIAANGSELSFNYVIDAETQADAATIERVADACLVEYYDAIGRVWISQGSELT